MRPKDRRGDHGALRQAKEQGRTILMVTHDTHIAAYSQRTIHLLDGRIF